MSFSDLPTIPEFNLPDPQTIRDWQSMRDWLQGLLLLLQDRMRLVRVGLDRTRQAGVDLASHNLLDGDVHTDTAADSVTRGSLIYGNSTPAWDELVVGAASTFLQSDGTDVAWVALAGDATLSAGTMTIANNAVSYAKMQDVSAASRLLGRGSAGGSGDPEEIALGVGLVMSATTADVVLPGMCGGRLTLTTGTPVTTSDVTAAGTLYFTPYLHDKVALYDGTNWALYTFTERSLTLTLTSGKNYDVFLYDNSGTLTLELSAAWTDDTTRADALTTQNGAYVKSGAATRRYLGTLRASGTNTTEDSAAKRFLWNYQNRVVRVLEVKDTTDTWTYTLSAWQQANASTANQVEVVAGFAEDAVHLIVNALSSNSSASIGRTVGIGANSVTTPTLGTTGQGNAAAAANVTHMGALTQVQRLGYSYYAWLERSTASGTTTWSGDAGGTTFQSGIQGTWRC